MSKRPESRLGAMVLDACAFAPRRRGRSTSSRCALAILVASTCGVAGCGGEAAAPSQEATPAPGPSPTLPIAAPRAVSGSLAFDLVATPEGAVLAWGAPMAQGGGVRALALDPDGGPRGVEVQVSAPPDREPDGEPATIVEELVLGVAGGRLGVAWVVSGLQPEVQATFSSRELEGLARPRTIAPTTTLVRGERASRGRVALASRDDGTLGLIHRLVDAPCSGAQPGGEQGALCAQIARSDVSTMRRDAEPRLEAELPDACPSALSGAASSEGTWFHTLCSRRSVSGEAGPATTLYAIRPAVSYAAAVEVVPGSDESALVPLEDGVLVVGQREPQLGDQGGGQGGIERDVSFVDTMGRETMAIRDAHVEISCDAGRPVVALRGEGGARELPLIASVSRIEGLLPEALAPRGARAVWTGSALLVAAPLGREVSLRRYQCRDGRLLRTDLP